MKKLLTVLDTLTTATLPFAVVTTLILSVAKLLSYVSYSWLLAFSPMVTGILAVGVVNFFSFYLDQD